MTLPSASRLCVRLRRAAASLALAGGMLLGFGGASTQTVIANGDTRTLTMLHKHTGEQILITFKRFGRYDPAALQRLNWFLRDWRRDEATRMDPLLFDVIWEVYRSAGASEPIHVVSAYRSEGTNAMLRRRSRAVARNSQHIAGRAVDFYIPGASMHRVREAGIILQRGGVGFYPGSANRFVHMDTGSVRTWPRLSRDHLARLFPDGRTVHIPADGRPLPGYDAALAMVQARGGRASRFYDPREEEQPFEEDPSQVVRNRGTGPNFLTALFGGGQTQEAAPTRAAPSRPARTPPRPADPAPAPRAAEPAPAPIPAPVPVQTPAPTPAPAPTLVARIAPPTQITPNTPRMLIAAAPIPVRAPPAAERLRGNQDDEEDEAPTQIAAAPLPSPRPAELMVAEAQPAPAAPTVVAAATPAAAPIVADRNRPFPLPEPNAARTTATASIPALIATGEQRPTATPPVAPPAAALAFASPNDPPLSVRPQAPVAAAPSVAPPAPVVAFAAPVPRAHPAADLPAISEAAPVMAMLGPSRSIAPPAPARAPSAPTAQRAPAPPALVATTPTDRAKTRVVFAGRPARSDTANGGFVTPDPRQGGLIAAPQQIVAATFQRGAPTPGDRFHGSATAPIRTLDFAPAPPQRRASLER